MLLKQLMKNIFVLSLFLKFITACVLPQPPIYNGIIACYERGIPKIVNSYLNCQDAPVRRNPSDRGPLIPSQIIEINTLATGWNFDFCPLKGQYELFGQPHGDIQPFRGLLRQKPSLNCNKQLTQEQCKILCVGQVLQAQGSYQI